MLEKRSVFGSAFQKHMTKSKRTQKHERKRVEYCVVRDQKILGRWMINRNNFLTFLQNDIFTFLSSILCCLFFSVSVDLVVMNNDKSFLQYDFLMFLSFILLIKFLCMNFKIWFRIHYVREKDIKFEHVQIKI